MNAASYAYEDFTPQRIFALGPRQVTAQDIVGFAAEFDPQLMHLSQEDGTESILGGLAASGWHICGMMMRMMTDSYLLASTSEGSPGIEEMRWITPVLAEDVLSGRSIVQEARPLKSRPGIGLVRFRHELENQRGELVCACDNVIMFRMARKTETIA